METKNEKNEKTEEQPKILVVDDNEEALASLRAVLEVNQFQVTTATNVTDALELVVHLPFDVLLSDLHMPGPGDGFTVVSAMRHANPNAVTLVFTGFPALKQAMDAILLQADEVLVKPMKVPALIALIREKLQKHGERKIRTCVELSARTNLPVCRSATSSAQGTFRSCFRNLSTACGYREVLGRKRFRRPPPRTAEFAASKAIRFR